MRDAPVCCPHTAATTRLDQTWRGRVTAARCLSCGHRARDVRPDGSVARPRQTRSTPSRWLTELPRRRAARRMGRRARPAR